MNKPLLQVKELNMRFLGLTAVEKVSFTVDCGSITCLIGRTGAGKTTTFNCITGMCRPTLGCALFEGEDITAKAAHVLARHGIARTFQNIALFGGLTVLDNLLMGAYGQGSSGLLQGALSSQRARVEQPATIHAAHEVLDFLGMKDAAEMLPAEMSYGRQKQVEFGRTLMQRGRLILLDELMAGMSGAEKVVMTDSIRRVRSDFGMPILILEHDIPVVMEISDNVVVLNFGRKIADATPGEVMASEAVIAAYLGEDFYAPVDTEASSNGLPH